MVAHVRRDVIRQWRNARAAAAPATRPNILFLMADDWSAPHARALGDPVVNTPTFDRVAREGALFSHAFASAPSCTPSRLAIATGQWHWRLKEGSTLGGSLREGVPVYAVLLEAAGYRIGFARKGAEPSDHKFTHRDPFGTRYKTFSEFMAENAMAGGKYDRVERRDSEGRKTMDRAYAMVNPQEYFAECTEAFFSQNDIYPYARDELKKHDPAMFDLLARIWGVKAKPRPPKRKTAGAR